VAYDRWLDLVGQAVDEPDVARARALWTEAEEVAEGPLRRSLALAQLGRLEVLEGAIERGIARYAQARDVGGYQPFVFLNAGEALLDAGQPRTAEEWLRTGVETLLEDDPDRQLEEALELWDRALEASGRDGGKLREAAGEELDGEWFDDARRMRASVTVPWLPPDLWEEARAAGSLPESQRAPTHREYSAEVDRIARAMRAEGLLVVAVRPVGAQDEAVGEVVPWPPGRNERCWCGTGQKYKRCCGRS
jgi:tetratricopeptide (TPR) repeat protein